MSGNLLGRLLVASAVLALAACGGEDSTYVASLPPPPSPMPALPSVTVLGPIFPNLTTDTNFATLGLGAASASIPASALVRDGFSVKFDAASNAYVIDLPFQAGTASPGYHVDSVGVAKPSDFQLTYTTIGTIATGYYTTSFGFFAFGSVTPTSGIPLSGTASYDANVVGRTLDSYFKANQTGGSAVTGSISGAATLQFDFGAGTLAGHFDPILTYFDETATPGIDKTINLGSYNFVNTVYGAGKADFSGQLSISGTSTPGAFDGQFTGPVAQELMARWTAPYLNPVTKQWSDMFGVWVGKKH